MARMRSLKPEFWDDRKLALAASRDARMLYMGLWNHADEHSRCNGDPLWLKGRIFPYEDDITACVVEKLLAELASCGRVVQYEVEGDPYLLLPKLDKHQRLEPKVESRLPPPPPAGTDDPEPDPGESARDPDESALDTKEPGGSAAKHVAGSSEHVAGSRGSRGAARKTRSTQTTIPDDLVLDDAMLATAVKHGMPPPVADREFATFTAWHRSKQTKYADWRQAWVTWVLRWQTNREQQAPPDREWG